MEFIKMQGLGNDFIIAEKSSWEEASRLQPYAPALCRRNYGIGADGLVIAGPGTNTDLFMRIFNPDGSEAEMCGNAIRCIAYFFHRQGRIDNNQFTIQTRSGEKHVEMVAAEDDAKLIRVDMGEPVLDRRLIPIRGTGDIKTFLEAADTRFEITAVSLGNPHCVVFVENIDDFDIKKWGPLIENHWLFPNRTNVEFVEINGTGEMTMRVWERGAGITLACGTGACASLAAAVLNNKTSRKAVVHLDGGDLFIEWDALNNHIYMTGGACEVFRGIIDLENIQI